MDARRPTAPPHGSPVLGPAVPWLLVAARCGGLCSDRTTHQSRGRLDSRPDPWAARGAGLGSDTLTGWEEAGLGAGPRPRPLECADRAMATRTGAPRPSAGGSGAAGGLHPSSALPATENPCLCLLGPRGQGCPASVQDRCVGLTPRPVPEGPGGSEKDVRGLRSHTRTRQRGRPEWMTEAACSLVYGCETGSWTPGQDGPLRPESILPTQAACPSACPLLGKRAPTPGRKGLHLASWARSATRGPGWSRTAPTLS